MQNLRSFQMGHVMLSIYFIISLMHMLQAQDPPVWDEGGQTVIETITENGGFGYMVLKWQFISSTEPTLISWLYESNIIMRKVPGLDAIGVGASHEDRVSYQENGLCSINPFSGCIRINSTTISDVGNYNIEITTTSGNLNGDGSVVSIAFDDPDGTIRKHCVVVIGEASYSLNTTSVVAENGTTVRTECPPDQVPSSFITIGIDGEETKCDGTPITSCETPNVNLFPGGSLKITFDFSSTPDVIINIKIEDSATTILPPESSTPDLPADSTTVMLSEPSIGVTGESSTPDLPKDSTTAGPTEPPIVTTEGYTDDGLSTGAIAGIAVGCTVGVAAIATGVAVPLSRRRKNQL